MKLLFAEGEFLCEVDPFVAEVLKRYSAPDHPGRTCSKEAIDANLRDARGQFLANRGRLILRAGALLNTAVNQARGAI